MFWFFRCIIKKTVPSTGKKQIVPPAIEFGAKLWKQRMKNIQNQRLKVK